MEGSKSVYSVNGNQQIRLYVGVCFMLLGFFLIYIASCSTFDSTKTTINFSTGAHTVNQLITELNNPLASQSIPQLTVAIGIYQEVRTLSDNLGSLNEFVIQPLIRNGAKVDLFLSLASRDNISTSSERSFVLNSLTEENLVSYVADFEHYSTNGLDSLSWNKKFMGLISKHSNICDNPCEPLILQYYMRHRLNERMMSYFSRDSITEYNIVVYARSDMKFGSNIWREIFTDKVSALGTDDLLQKNIVYKPMFEDWKGVNDRLMVLSMASFRSYTDRFEEKLKDYIIQGRKIHGETIHKYMLLTFTSVDMIKEIQICYGVQRTFSCDWTDYGQEACGNLGVRISQIASNVHQKRCPQPPKLPVFRDYVDKLQRDCSLPVTFIQAGHHGFGHMLNDGLMHAVHAWIHGNRTSFIPELSVENSSYYDEHVCNSFGQNNILACLFEPISSCDDSSKYTQLGLPGGNIINETIIRNEFKSQQTFLELAYHPLFWSQVYRYMYKPSQHMLHLMNRHRSSIEKQRSSTNQSYICVLLQGKENSKEATTFSPILYANTTLSHLLNHNESVHLISGDQDRTQMYYKYMSEHSSSDIQIARFIARNDRRKFLQVTMILSNLEYCAKARVVIGSLSSNWMRLVLSMRAKSIEDLESVVNLDDKTDVPFFRAKTMY